MLHGWISIWKFVQQLPRKVSDIGMESRAQSKDVMESKARSNVITAFRDTCLSMAWFKDGCLSTRFKDQSWSSGSLQPPSLWSWHVQGTRTLPAGGCSSSGLGSSGVPSRPPAHRVEEISCRNAALPLIWGIHTLNRTMDGERERGVIWGMISWFLISQDRDMMQKIWNDRYVDNLRKNNRSKWVNGWWRGRESATMVNIYAVLIFRFVGDDTGKQILISHVFTFL